MKKLEEINAERIKNGQKPWPPGQIHGHHIVMKDSWDPWSVASRMILENHDIDVLYTMQQLKNADADELHNLSIAINGWSGIHSERYAQVVWKRLFDALTEGGNKDQVRARLIRVLGEMREQLEDGKTFW